jgi:hypothetical protein
METSVFEQFPKIRPFLPEDIARIYSVHYKANREGRTVATSWSKRMESWLHRQVAADVREQRLPKTTLEIGAGTLNQLEYEPEVGPYDIVEPFQELYQGSSLLKRVRNIYPDIAGVPEERQYDRITSIATFEHICDLPDVMARCGLLLAPHGQLRVSIPSEGTLLWSLAWRLTTGLEFRIKHGLDYGLLMKYEHVNRAKEIDELLRYFFRHVTWDVFGICKSLSLYQFYSCCDPILDRCSECAGQSAQHPRIARRLRHPAPPACNA